MKKLLLLAVLSAIFAVALAACGEEAAPAAQVVEVPKEVIVEKEVLKEVPVVQVVEKEVVKVVEVPGETVVVEKQVEVVKTVKVPVETIKEVVQVVEIATSLLPEFGEAPELAQLVQAGKLPPVAERIGKDPLVIAVQEVGRYGGTWRRAFTSPNDGWNFGRLNKTSLVRWSTDGTRILPGVAKSWSSSADGKVWTFKLREGMRWSDGVPVTADDYIFQFEDITLDPRLTIQTEEGGGSSAGFGRKDRRLYDNDDLRELELQLHGGVDPDRFLREHRPWLAVGHPLLAPTLPQAVPSEVC